MEPPPELEPPELLPESAPPLDDASAPELLSEAPPVELLPLEPPPVEPLPVEPRHLVGLLLGALKVSATERALVLNPIQLISVVTRARIRDELAELAGGQL